MAEAELVERIRGHVRQELALEAERKQELLEGCGIAEEDLSKNGQVYLQVLSEVAALLQLKNTETSSYLSAMSDLERQLDDTQSDVAEMRVVAASAQRRSQELLIESSHLEQVQRHLDDAVTERELHESTSALEQRTAESIERQRAYERELREIESALEDMDFGGVQDKMEHHNLDVLERECDSLDATNRSLREQMSVYHDLPLSKDMAAAQLLQLKGELTQLETQFSSQIKQML